MLGYQEDEVTAEEQANAGCLVSSKFRTSQSKQLWKTDKQCGYAPTHGSFDYHEYSLCNNYYGGSALTPQKDTVRNCARFV